MVVCRARRPLVVFDERSQALQRLIPVLGDLVEVAACLLEPGCIERPDAFPPPPAIMDEAGTSEDLQVLGDRLARHGGAGREPGGRLGPAGAGAGYQERESVVEGKRGDVGG